MGLVYSGRRIRGGAEGRAAGTFLKEIASQCKLSVEQVKEILE